MAFMDTPDFQTHKLSWMLHAGFEGGLQSDSERHGCQSIEGSNNV
jgi:hypothetical protein